ncbi:helix-turn-helix domain-containing protein [Muricoccus radiodurans]|uniref:helix-turn-helix domain-containing protein n=1 Tax=Muricoccus radiodurans TaxID=2231721 RepID=UPI003CF4DBF4
MAGRAVGEAEGWSDPLGIAGTGETGPGERLTPAQCRAARALLGWSVERLAKAVPCRRDTVEYFESGSGRPRPSTAGRLRAAFETAGVEFTDEEEAGVRLRTAP